MMQQLKLLILTAMIPIFIIGLLVTAQMIKNANFPYVAGQYGTICRKTESRQPLNMTKPKYFRNLIECQKWVILPLTKRK